MTEADANPQRDGQELTALFGRFEYALKRTDFLKNRGNAEADWDKFSKELGKEFFDHIVASKIAHTLINHPPRKLSAPELEWKPENPSPLSNVFELIVWGVCRVRNSFFHGEKFVGGSANWERDAILVSEALAVLREAEKRVPRVAKKIEQAAAGPKPK